MWTRDFEQVYFKKAINYFVKGWRKRESKDLSGHESNDFPDSWGVKCETRLLQQNNMQKKVWECTLVIVVLL